MAGLKLASPELSGLCEKPGDGHFFEDLVVKLKSKNVLCVQWMAWFGHVFAQVLPILSIALTGFGYGES